MKTRLLSALLLALPGGLFACQCLFTLTFCEAVAPSSNVAAVSILNTYYEGIYHKMDVVVLEVLQGSLSEDTLTIITGSGTDCEPSAESFVPGDSLIVEIPEGISAGSSGWTAFSLPVICQASFLRLKNGLVLGSISPGTGEQLYEEFKSNVGSCALMTFAPGKEQIERWIYLFPNPSSTEIFLGFEKSFGQPAYSIFSATGALCAIPAELQPGYYRFDISSLPAGVYFMRIELGGYSFVRRFVKQDL